MNNIVDYAQTNLKTFDECKFNPVDSLILSRFASMHLPKSIPELSTWQGIRIADLFRAEYFDEMFRGLWDAESSLRLFVAMAASPRFRNMRIAGFSEKFDPREEKQFCAMTFISEDLSYVAFRGTDSTFVGWKEDFNMAFKYPIPSQEEARVFLDDAAKHTSGEMRVGGHSKGGNLAVYSAAKCMPETAKRISKVYSHDGPGFPESVLQKDEFVRMSDKTDKTLPQSSIVGMLLESQENFRIVKSNRVSFMQHDPFSWEINGTDFASAEHLTPDARYLDKTLNGWLASMPESEREKFVDTLYGLIDTENILTFPEFKADLHKNIPALVRALSELDDESKSQLTRALKKLASLAIKSFPEILTRTEK